MSGEQESEQPIENDVAGLRKVLEKQGKELKEANERIAKFQRSEAFEQAGIPAGDDGSWQAMFRQTYDGDLEADAIKSAYGKLGIPDPTPPSTPEPAAQPEPSGQPEPQLDQATMAAMQDGQQIRTEFSPPIGEGNPLMEALGKAETPADLERIAREGGFLAEPG